MQYRFESLTGVVVGKYALSHGRTIECAVSGDHIIAELLSYFVQGRLARFDDLAGDDIGIDQLRAERSEHVGNGRLATGDAACQADSQRFAGCASHLERQVEGVLDPVAPEHRQPAGARKERTERHRHLVIATAKNDQRDTEDCADDR